MQGYERYQKTEKPSEIRGDQVNMTTHARWGFGLDPGLEKKGITAKI